MAPNRLVWNAIVSPASMGGAPEAIIIAMNAVLSAATCAVCDANR